MFMVHAGWNRLDDSYTAETMIHKESAMKALFIHPQGIGNCIVPIIIATSRQQVSSRKQDVPHEPYKIFF